MIRTVIPSVFTYAQFTKPDFHSFQIVRRQTKSRSKVLLRLSDNGTASGREGLHEIWAHRRLDHIVLKGDRSGQIRFHNFCNSRIHFALIALCIPFLRPESNGDGLLSSGLGYERQDFQESRLLLQNGQDFVTYNLKQFFFLFNFRNEFNNACKHDGFSFSLFKDWCHRKLPLGPQYCVISFWARPMLGVYGQYHETVLRYALEPQKSVTRDTHSCDSQHCHAFWTP